MYEHELTCNPDGCTKFEPNPFKPEKCKNCGHPWRQHLGIIDDAIVEKFLSKINKEAEDKKKAEEEAKAKAKAKKLAKKQQAQAVEDEWFLDDEKERMESTEVDSDDDDAGFRMFVPESMANANLDKPRQAAETAYKPLKVVNLIDFGECDVPEDPPPANLGIGAGSATTTLPAQGSASSLSGFETPGSVPPMAPAAPQAMNGVLPPPVAAPAPTPGGPDLEKERLKEELDHMRQMLADSIEEKNISVAIVQDEVAEKQLAIDDLTRQRSEAEASLKEAHAEIEALKAELLQQQQPPPQPADAPVVEDRSEEVARLGAELEALRAELAGAARASAEVEELRAALSGARTAAAEASSEAEAARTAQASAEADAVAARAEARAAAEAAADAKAAKDEHLAGAEGGGGLSPDEAYAAAVEMQRHAAEVLREIRIKADHQMSWLTKRMCESHLQVAGQAVV